MNKVSSQTHNVPARTQVAIVAPSLEHYRVPLVNRLNALPNVDVTALLSYAPTKNKGPHDWHFEYKTFPTKSFTFRRKSGDLVGFSASPGLLSHLNKTPYDIVITLGWTIPNTIGTLAQRKLSHRPVVLWEESIPHPARPFKQRMMPALRQYFRSFDAYLAASSWCMDYLVSMGAPRERVVLFPQVTDNDFFTNGVAALRPQRQQLKQALGIQTEQVILFVGQFIPRKGMRPLFDAFERIAANNPQVSLLLVGKGLLQPEMCEWRSQSNFGERIFIQGFTAQDELPKFYSIADVFVLPSLYDTFGVVVDEAMASGLPIVTTNRVGAVADLVRDGENGRVVSPNDAPELAQALTQILNDAELRNTMSHRSVERISKWTVDEAAQGLLRCIEICKNI